MSLLSAKTSRQATEATLHDYYAARILAHLANQTFEPPEKLVRRAFALATRTSRRRAPTSTRLG